MVKLTSIMNLSIAMQRTIAFSMLIVCCSILLGAGYVGVSNFKANAEAIVEKRFALGRLKAVAQLGSVLEKSTEQTVVKGSNSDFLEGSSEAVILAGLQGRLNEIAKSHRVLVQSVANLPIRTKDEIRFAGVAADVQGTDQSIHALLFEIETSVPYLVIRKVNLRSVSGAGTKQSGPPQLVARIEFFGALSPELGQVVTQ